MPYLLPEKYTFRHNYCFFIHDLMVKIIQSAEEKHDFWVKFTPKKEEIEAFKKLSGVELNEWMINNNYKQEADLLTYKQIFAATLSDLLQFVFHCLRTSEKGHLSVTYSLLRKPLKDNLFILEFLLSDPDAFLGKFNSEKSYEEIAIDNIDPKDKLNIITDAFKKIPFPMLDAEFIYKLRYSKSDDIGLEKIWEKATHIVTSCRHYKTEKGNLNFIFSDKDAKDEQWEYLYLILPNILFYTYQVVASLYFGTINKENEIDQEVWDRLLLGNAISNKASIKGQSKIDTENDNVELTCHKCKRAVKYNSNMEIEITNSGIYKCEKGHKSNFFKI